MLFQAADQIRHLDRLMPALQEAANARDEPRPAGRRYDRVLGCSAILAAAIIAAPQLLPGLAQLPIASLVIGGIGLYWLLRQ